MNIGEHRCKSLTSLCLGRAYWSKEVCNQVMPPSWTGPLCGFLCLWIAFEFKVVTEPLPPFATQRVLAF